MSQIIIKFLFFVNCEWNQSLKLIKNGLKLSVLQMDWTILKSYFMDACKRRRISFFFSCATSCVSEIPNWTTNAYIWTME